MIVIEQLPELRAALAEWRLRGPIGFVPTMGNLHAGHLKLVEEARAVSECVVASIFVNPLQFGDGEDFGSYPRTFEEDRRKLAKEGTDVLFAPTVEIIYPRPQAEQTRVEVPELSDIFCGESRPEHFVGVATVVCKLFNMVQPDIALFGEKDYQQLMVIRRMTEDLNFPIEIRGVATVRENDGLAMSSRNGYLTADERSRAPALNAQLTAIVDALRAGQRDFSALEEAAKSGLSEAGLEPDYLSVRRAWDLGSPRASDSHFVVLGAAYLGKARLIDNVEISG